MRLIFMLLNLHITLTYSEQFIRTAQSEQMNYNFNLNNIPDKCYLYGTRYSGQLKLEASYH